MSEEAGVSQTAFGRQVCSLKQHRNASPNARILSEKIEQGSAAACLAVSNNDWELTRMDGSRSADQAYTGPPLRDYTAADLDALYGKLGIEEHKFDYDIVTSRNDNHFRGRLEYCALCWGGLLALSDGKVTAHARQSSIKPRSLVLTLMLRGSSGRARFGSSSDLTLVAGNMAIVGIAERMQISGENRTGASGRSVTLNAEPQDISEHYIGEMLERMLAHDTVSIEAIPSRLMQLGGELFQLNLQEGPGKLLAESLSLDLLARAYCKLVPVGSVPCISREGKIDRKIAIVRDQLIAELDRDHSLSDLARNAGLSVTTLKDAFPKVTGMTVFEYLRERRLEYAREGLAEKGWSVSQASWSVGYRHAANFSTAFRQRFGVTPSEFKRNARR